MFLPPIQNGFRLKPLIVPPTQRRCMLANNTDYHVFAYPGRTSTARYSHATILPAGSNRAALLKAVTSHCTASPIESRNILLMSRYLGSRIEEPIWLEPSDISFLRTRISSAEAQLGSFATQTNELLQLQLSIKAQISKLARQTDATLVEIASYRNMLSPVRRIPLEILCEILILSCLPEHGHWSWDYDIVCRTSRISRVCVAWRNAAHSIPRLWSNLCLDPEVNWKVFQAGGREIGWLKAWVDRCQGHPLNLYLNFKVEKKHRYGAMKLFESLLCFGNKIRLLHFVGTPSSYLPLLRLPRSSLPLLEEVYFEVHDSVNDLEVEDTVEDLLPLFPGDNVDVLLGASKLRRFEVNEFCSISFLALLTPPVEQLTSLKITSDGECDDHAEFAFLRRCHKLVNLQLVYESERCLIKLTGTSPDPPISFPSLKHLTLSGHKLIGSGVRANLLGRIIAPQLEKLTLQHGSQQPHDLFMDVVGFQQRSATTLSTLHLRLFYTHGDRKIMTKNMIAILSVFPTVTSLRIEDCAFDAKLLLRRLTIHRGYDDVLPNLSYLEIDFYHGNEECSLDFTAMVYSRWWPDELRHDHSGLVRLRKVVVRGYLSIFNEVDIELPGLTVDTHLTEEF